MRTSYNMNMIMCGRIVKKNRDVGVLSVSLNCNLRRPTRSTWRARARTHILYSNI